MVQAISGNDIISAAEKYKGVPYSQRNPQSPATGFDCSGIVQQAMADLGVSIPRTTSTQLAAAIAGTSGTNVGTNLANAQPGDIIHYVGHEEIWLGNGMVFSEATFGEVADIRPRTPWPIIGIVRYWTVASSANALNLAGGSGGTPAQVNSSNINAAIDALPDIPFGIVKPMLHFIVTPIVDLSNFIATVGNPGFWERVTLAFLGGIILAIGLYGMLKHKQVITVTQQMIKKGASVASAS